jgi:signal transduction histidine kinase
MATFTVDTHLFRELGQFLVGRDSTALVELIKNAYDADASEVIVYGESLSDLERGFIQIIDDGNGMSLDQFQKGFLTVASRTKEQGQRLSPFYKRRFTGAKGIGRLAAHKLSRLLEVSSVPRNATNLNSIRATDAVIDWDEIERYETLDQLENTSAIILESKSIPPSTKQGTVITLRKLRRRWTTTERGRFFQDIQTFEPPSILVSPLPNQIVSEPIMFNQLLVRDSASSDPGFRVILDGDFAGGDDYWQVVAESSSWIIEINAKRNETKVDVVIAPTNLILRQKPWVKPTSLQIDHPDTQNGPFFQSRILVREGPLRGSGARSRLDWARRSAGVRVFMEGFRVLPYGEPNNDWLKLDADYARRTRKLGLLPETDQLSFLDDEQDDKDVGLNILPNASYYGAVLLTEEGSPSLRMLVNREGFVPEAGYDNLFSIVRGAIDLSVRVRAATNADQRNERREQRNEPTVNPVPSVPVVQQPSESLKEVIAEATDMVQEARRLAASGNFTDASTKFTEATSKIESYATTTDQLISERSMLRVLASVGSQMAAFIHEMNALLGMAQSIDIAISDIRNSYPVSDTMRGQLAQLQTSISELRQGIERQAAYLIDVVTPDARRRRTRQGLAERFDAGTRLVERQAQKRDIEIINEIPDNLKSPPMFPAELTTIFSNLLTNAVKAAGYGGRIWAHGEKQEDGKVRILIENTGVSVDLSSSERWFRPFESTTTSVDPVLGQGMGLGLPITRNMVDEYGGEIRFVSPANGFSTAVEIIFPR